MSSKTWRLHRGDIHEFITAQLCVQLESGVSAKQKRISSNLLHCVMSLLDTDYNPPPPPAGADVINCLVKPRNASTNCKPTRATCLYNITNDPCEFYNIAAWNQGTPRCCIFVIIRQFLSTSYTPPKAFNWLSLWRSIQLGHWRLRLQVMARYWVERSRSL